MANHSSYSLSRLFILLIYLTSFLLFSSGVGWMLVHTFLNRVNEFGTTPHPSQAILLATHGFFAVCMLLVLGSLIPTHIVPAWLTAKNRASGAILLALNLLLIATGYGLYYAGGETMRSFLHQFHWWIGLLFPVQFIAHLWFAPKK